MFEMKARGSTVSREVLGGGTAFLTMVTMPFAFSISPGIAVGFVTYAFGKVITGRPTRCPLLVYIFAALFILRYALWH